MSTITPPQPTLKRSLRTWHIWALAVGLVISGEYFGWNFGWKIAGTTGFLLATTIVTVMYFAFIFSYAELTTMIPHAGGPYAYAYKAFGRIGGMIAGYATLIEFLFATPAIAFAIGNYLHFLYPGLEVTHMAILCYIIFTVVNIIGIDFSALVGSIIAIIAVCELLLYMGIIAPHFDTANFFDDKTHLGISLSDGRSWGLITKALPYAVWFYLGIEGVAMLSEETADHKKNMPLGSILGIITLGLLVYGVLILTAGLPHWDKLLDIGYPIPEAISSVLGHGSTLSRAFAGIGMAGLIASFHSIIISTSRQIFALSRGKFLPAFLTRLNRRQTPHWAIITSSLFGIASILTGTMDYLITLSVLGAVVMYIISMASLMMLRVNHAKLKRPYKTPLYPILPVVALALSAVCLFAIIAANVKASIWFGALLIVGLAIFYWRKEHHRKEHEHFHTEAHEAR